MQLMAMVGLSGSALAADGWQRIGPDGFMIQSLAIDPTDTQVVYAGTWDGGVFRSENGGGAWSEVNSGLTTTEVDSLVIDPADTRIVYVGTRDGGVFRSENGGGSWNEVNSGLTSTEVRALAIDPSSSQTLYVGTAYGGVFKSENGGSSWNAGNSGLTTAGVYALAIDPLSPQTLYAGTGYGGVFKSENGGGSWSEVNSGLTSTFVQALVIDPSRSQTLYVGTAYGGVFKSEDGGGSWGEVNSGLTTAGVYALLIDPTHPQTLYAGTAYGGVFKSEDSGTSWSELNDGLTDTGVSSLVLDPLRPQTLYAGTNSSVFKSVTGGTGQPTVSALVIGGNGTVTCTLPTNGSSTCTITPATGYALATLSDNGVDVVGAVADNRYTLGTISEGHTIRATFDTQTFTMPVTVTGGNGTVSCTNQIAYNGTCTCTITPATGYQLATLTDDGVDVISAVVDNSYTFTNVTEVHDIGATFTTQARIDGTCGSADHTVSATIPAASPATNLCGGGSASAITGSGPWYWSCGGSGGGTTAYCSANSTDSLTATINQIDTGACPLIKLYATIADESGNPLTGLAIADFVVMENGVVQTPISVSTASRSEPVSVGLTLDYSGSMNGTPISDMEAAAVGFINQLGSEDTAEIVKFSTTVQTVAGFAADKAALSGAVTAAWSGAGRNTALYDAIYQTVSETSQRSGRKAVIAMTDGRENASTHTLVQVTNLALAGGVPVFTVGLGNVDATELQTLATSTGGQYYYAPSSADLQAIYDHIAAIINSQYTVTYTTTNTNTTTATRTVAVEVVSGGVTVTTAKRYSGCVSDSTTVAPPAGITVPASDADGSYTVRWSSSTTAAFGITYTLQEATNRNFTANRRSFSMGAALSKIIPGRATGKTYYYRVRAKKSGWAASDWTTAAKGCLVKFPAGAPGPLTVPAADLDGDYEVSWTPSVTPGVTYVLQEATNTTFTKGRRTVPHTALLSATISGHSPGTTYYYRVYAKKSGYGNSAWRGGDNGCRVGTP